MEPKRDERGKGDARKKVNSETLAVIDYQQLCNYTMGDKVLEAELLDLFDMQLDQQVMALRKATSSEAWYMAAHTIKGGAMAIGAEQIASIAEKLEEARKDLPGSRRNELLTQLDAACAAFRQLIESGGL